MQNLRFQPKLTKQNSNPLVFERWSWKWTQNKQTELESYKTKGSRKKLQNVKMVEHEMASNNNNQTSRIKHQVIRKRFVLISTCLVLGFVLLALKLSLATLTSKPSKSPCILWFLMLFQLLGPFEGEWWRKSEGLMGGCVIFEKMRKGRILGFFVLLILISWSSCCLWLRSHQLIGYL
jgi:hypothetical protein